MSKRQWLCVLGAWIAVFLFLGVPPLWDRIIAAASGLIIIIIGYNLPHERRQGPISGGSCVENNNQPPVA